HYPEITHTEQIQQKTQRRLYLHARRMGGERPPNKADRPGKVSAVLSFGGSDQKQDRDSRGQNSLAVPEAAHANFRCARRRAYGLPGSSAGHLDVDKPNPRIEPEGRVRLLMDKSSRRT